MYGVTHLCRVTPDDGTATDVLAALVPVIYHMGIYTT